MSADGGRRGPSSIVHLRAGLDVHWRFILALREPGQPTAGVTAIEGNGRQYCPAGNEAYMTSYAPMFRVRYGTIPTQLLDGVGLGFQWQPL